MGKITRRETLTGAAMLAAAPAIAKAAPSAKAERIAVIGAGVFGAWTAERLRAAGHKVRLIDAWGPAHSRASSGGESRMTRGAYGADSVYTRMALDSLADWKRLSAQSQLPLFHEAGVLFFFPRIEPYVLDTIEAHRRLGLPTERLDRPAMQRRFPMIDFADIEIGLFEPGFGALMARRAVQELVSDFRRSGGDYELAAIAPPAIDEDRLRFVATLDGRRIEADRFVFACGPWLAKLFPDLLQRRIFPTRQEVFFFAPEAGDDRFEVGRLPGWADFNGGDIFYGFPNLENRGFKIAHDKHGAPMDPDTADRRPSAEALAEVRSFMERRFPALARRPLTEARVCQYENSANGDFLIDFHPQLRNVLLVGGGSGHGFKHGPAVGTYAASMLMGSLATLEPRFSLASKSEQENRSVH